MTYLKEDKYFHAFNLTGGVGPVSFKKILNHFRSLKDAWRANTGEYARTGISQSIIDEIQKKRIKINPDRELEKISGQNIGIISIKNKEYPKLLKEIYAPPALLYIRGRFAPSDKLSLGVVGPRKVSLYGKQITPLLVADICQKGLTIVSGLAKGVDTLAHQTALENGSRTIAVLGSGIDSKSIYPRSNTRLAEKIIQAGAVISEYPPGAKPFAQNFPQRNRIISGLCLGVIVIEAREKSGALITAGNALEQNREVFAVPGSIISPNSTGTNNLIKLGAKLVSCAKDVFEELHLDYSRQTKTKNNRAENKEEEFILGRLSQKPLHIDKIINQTKLSTAKTISTLTILEMKGRVRNLGGNNYVIN